MFLSILPFSPFCGQTSPQCHAAITVLYCRDATGQVISSAPIPPDVHFTLNIQAKQTKKFCFCDLHSCRKYSTLYLKRILPLRSTDNYLFFALTIQKNIKGDQWKSHALKFRGKHQRKYLFKCDITKPHKNICMIVIKRGENHGV